MKKIVITIITILSVLTGMAQTPSKAMVKAQLNQALISLNNIINNQSLDVVDFELDQLLNNLTIEQLQGIDEIAYWRQYAIEDFGKLYISEQERQVLKRVLEKKRAGMMHEALSNALSPSMLVTGGGNTKGQLAFQILLTCARTAVEYKKAGNELDIEELEANWALRKNDLSTTMDLRKELLGITYTLFGKYGLKENDRLTEKTATMLTNLYNEKDNSLRLRRLKDNQSQFGQILGYDYYLGMAYIDNNQPAMGVKYLKQYIENYKRTPIFRVNPYLGYASQAILTYDTSLNASGKVSMINNIIRNLPNDGVSAIACALVLKNQLNKPVEAISLLRKMIDKPSATQKNDMATLLLHWKDDWMNNQGLRKDIIKSISQTKDVGLDNHLYLVYLINPSKFWDHVNANIQIKDNPFAVGSKDFEIEVSRKYNREDNFKIYTEHHDGKLKIREYEAKLANSMTRKELEKKSAAIKTNSQIINLLFDYVGDGRYVVKSGLPTDRILANSYQPLKDFSITDSEAKELGKLCRKMMSGTAKLEYDVKSVKSVPNAKLPTFINPGSAGFKTFGKDVKDAVNANRTYNKNIKIDFEGKSLVVMPPVYNPVGEKFITIKLDSTFPITLIWSQGSGNKYVPYASIVNNHLKFAPGVNINEIMKEVHKKQTTPSLVKKVGNAAKSGYKDATKIAGKGVDKVKKAVKKDKNNTSKK